MALTDPHALGATALTEEDLEGFIPDFRPTHKELNELEASNIGEGQEWALRSRTSKVPGMLTDKYIQQLHKHLFGQVWKWAGEYRLRDTNIGVEPTQIRVHLRALFDDVAHQIEHAAYPAEELAIRLHHRLIFIHPFRNGNGRHERMMADILLIRHFDMQRLPWGGVLLGTGHPMREKYLAAMRTADAGDYGPLVRLCISGAPE